MTSAVCTAWLPEPTSRLFDIWLGNVQFAEEEIAHYVVVVLPRVDKNCMDVFMPLVLCHQWRYFHEIRSGTNYVEYLHKCSFWQIERDLCGT